MNLKLTARMQIIADFINEEDVVADVGTDHGYIPLWLVLNKKCKRAILTDVNQGPLDKAKANSEKYLANKGMIDMRLGSGIEVLEYSEADAVIIAGMGGLLIRDILSQNQKKTSSIKKFILQPRNNSYELRKWILSTLSGYRITEERIVKEGKKFSEVFCLVKNECITASDLERIEKADNLRLLHDISDDLSLEIPCMYLINPDDTVKEYINKRILTEERIVDLIRHSGRSEESSHRLTMTEKHLSEIKKMAELCNIS